MAWNKSVIPFIAMSFISFFGYSQMDGNKYMIYFADKENSPYSISNPEEFLSPRSIQRRQNQGISIDEFDLPVNPSYIQTIAAFEEVEILGASKWFNAVLVKTDFPEVLEFIELLPGVDRWEVSRFYKRELPETWNKIAFPKSEELYGPSFNQINMLNGTPLHSDGYRGEGMYIAVLDGGFSYLQESFVFDSLLTDNRIVATYNFVNQNPAVFQNSTHGTYVLSTMAGNYPGMLVGTAPNASYVLCITEDSSTESRAEEIYWILGAEYADSVGVDIINTSLGYTRFDEGEADFTYADMDGNTTLISQASNRAASRGMLLVTSAGNEGNKPWYYISAPADADSVLAVGAVNEFEEAAAFSSRGPSADGRIKPNVMAKGQAAIITNLGAGIMAGNGTSFASPIMAGMAACLWQAIPQATAMQVFKAIEKSAHLFESPNDSMGYGIPDFEVARIILTQVVGLESRNPIPPKNQLIFFPNPFNSQQINLTRDHDISFPARAAIVNQEGKVVLSKWDILSSSQLEVSISQALTSSAPGVYTILVRDQNKNTHRSKIVKP